MPNDAIPCGSLRKLPVSAVADRCARAITGCRKPLAVTIDPEGRVTVEPCASAAEPDLIGVYRGDAGLMTLSRQLIEDLRYEVQVRGLRAA